MDYWYLTKRAQEAEALRSAHHRRCEELGDNGHLIEGIYHPHLVDGPGTYPIQVEPSWLGDTYLTAIAGFLGEVSLPRRDLAHKGSGPLAPPKFDAYPEDMDWSDWMFPSEPEWSKWGRASGAGRAVVREFRIAIDPGDSPPAKASEAVHDAIGDWWRLVKEWTEILTSQDLQGADRFHWSDGSAHLLYRDSAADDRWAGHIERSSLRHTWRPNMGFGASGHLSSAFHAAGCNHAPPLEWQLLREALRAFEGGQYRRVLVEAGIAAEVALNDHLTKHKRMPRKNKPTLGILVKQEEKAGVDSIVPRNFYEYVVETRNDVIHHGFVPTDDEAMVAFQLTTALVEKASPRDRLTEPYGLTLRQDPPFDPRRLG